jgi:Fuc2NAc and GlcNAc transferase
MFYVVLAFISFILTFLIKNYAVKKSLVDIPNDRSSHSVVTPYGGGIAVGITWFAGISYLFFKHNIDSSLYFALMIGVVIFVVSYFDDIYNLSPKIRLFAQFIVAGASLYVLGGLCKIDLYYFTITNQIFTNLFALFMIVWFINLYNFLDGIDGYAGSEAVFLGIAGFLLFGGNYFLVLIAAVLGFLVWNWHKAKIFMGDTGSTLLGYNIAIFMIYGTNLQAKNFWIWVVLFGLFWFDATLTLYRRYKNGEKLSLAHKKHAYQRLTQSGWSHSKVVIFASFVNIVLFCLVYFVPNIFISFFISLIVLYIIVRYIDNKKGFA